MNLSILFLCLALLAFLLDAAGVSFGRVRLVSVGLALFVAAQLVSGTIRTP